MADFGVKRHKVKKCFLKLQKAPKPDNLRSICNLLRPNEKSNHQNLLVISPVLCLKMKKIPRLCQWIFGIKYLKGLVKLFSNDHL